MSSEQERKGLAVVRLGRDKVARQLAGSSSHRSAHIIELGSRGGTYTAKKGLFSVFAAGGGIIRVPQITRRGVQARGFIDKAFKSTASEAERRIAEAIRKLVES